MSKYILAHDLGTSGNKATLFDGEGRMTAAVTEEYGTNIFNSNWAEQDPSDWWRAVCISTKKVLENINPSDLAAVSFSGQMMACLCVDKIGRPLRDALIYCDQRSEKQADELIGRVGFAKIYKITGHRPSSSYSLSKLMWIKENEPDVYAVTHKILQAKDYMNFRLTGEFFTDFNDASGTNAFDISTLSWSEEIIEASGVKRSLFPDAVASSTMIGEVTKSASKETGIPAGTPVAAGAGDGGCATIGAGSYKEGRAYCYMGSSSWVSVTSKTPLEDPDMKTFTWAHPIEGLYQPCGTMQTAGACFNWLSSFLLGNTDSTSLEQLNNHAAAAAPGAGGLFFLPYLLGERSPWWNPDAKGCFIGLDLNTGRNEAARAVIEGIAMNLNESLKIMKRQTAFDSIMFIGGGANGGVLRQIFADVIGMKVEIPKLLSEATSMGAALIGGVGSGIYSGFDMVEKMNPLVSTVENDESLKDFYSKHEAIFTDIYYNLKSSFSKIKSEQEIS
ncbi:MAG: FGGY-family carbohydrate kinase [Spirochaetales bacterium]|nr:FGGY-family carbohydrate kinase [Spirochaetales bacterium]